MVCLCAALTLMTGALMAQAVGSLHGIVTDPSGAAVPKATVTATGPNNTMKVVETNNDGEYTIPALPPGTYMVRVIATSFTLFEKAGVVVAAGPRPVSLDVKLVVEVSKQEITVTDTQQVELDPAKNAGALVLKAEDLDMLSDDPDDLQAELLALAGPAAGPNGGQIFIDGFSGGTLPPKDSIREIRINSNPFSAEYDTSGRGRIEIFTKPGSEKFHGSVNVTYSDWLFNARNPIVTSPAFKVPASDNKNLQANLSGPIIKGKLSFFVDYSRRQQREDDIINANILQPISLLPTSLGFAVIAPNTSDRFSPRFTYQLSKNISLDGRYSINTSNYGNQGIGGFSLPAGVPIAGITSSSSAQIQTTNNQAINLIETQVVNASTINETRFQFNRNRSDQTGDNPVLNISVADAFTAGSTILSNFNNANNYEIQNYTSITHGTHFIKFGIRARSYQTELASTNNFTGQFNFLNLTSYQILQQGIAAGLPFSQIVANGGGPFQYSFNAGNPQIGGYQWDLGPFIQDDWRIKPNITLSLGMRYEVQNNIGDHGDWAPRVGLAWGVGPSGGRVRTPKTVIRAGYGFFYTRFGLGSVLNADQLNGVNQLAYTITNPQFFPAAGVAIPSLSVLESPANQQASATYHISPDLQAPVMMQGAIGFDRQLPKNTTLSVNYIDSRGVHILRTVDINTPLPGTFTGPGTGVFPLGAAAGIFDQYQTTGIFKQSQLITNINARINNRISVFGFYAFGYADTNVIGGQPSNPYNFHEDWGPAPYDVRHRININGSILLPYGVRMSPNITYNSAPPFNVTQGIDEFGDTMTNSRPALAPAGFSAPTCTAAIADALTPCLVSGTKFGTFLINAPSGISPIPEGAFRAFGQFQFNVRISRTWGFGEPTAPNPNRQGQGGPRGGGPGFGQAAGGARGGGGGGARGGGGPGGGGGGENSGKKYSLTAGIFVHNLFNNVNYGIPETDLLSPRFGENISLQSIGGPFGASFNRRIDLSLRFAF
jgi:Carboxypeptidase regulatory-like domain/TonB dependent receptor